MFDDFDLDLQITPLANDPADLFSKGHDCNGGGGSSGGGGNPSNTIGSIMTISLTTPITSVIVSISVLISAGMNCNN